MNEFNHVFGDTPLKATDVRQFQVAIEQVHRLSLEVNRLQRENETLLRIIDRLSLKIGIDIENEKTDS